MLQNKPLVIAIIILLACLRFVFMPWSEQQQRQLSSLEAESQRLSRSLALLQTHDNLTEQTQAWSLLQQQQLDALLHGSSHNQLSLALQQQWQQKMQQHQVELDVFNWMLQTPFAEPDLFQAQISFRLEGSFAGVALAVAELEQQPGLVVRTMQLSWRRALQLEEGTINANIEVDIIYQLRKPV